MDIFFQELHRKKNHFKIKCHFTLKVRKPHYISRKRKKMEIERKKGGMIIWGVSVTEWSGHHAGNRRRA